MAVTWSLVSTVTCCFLMSINRILTERSNVLSYETIKGRQKYYIILLQGTGYLKSIYLIFVVIII